MRRSAECTNIRGERGSGWDGTIAHAAFAGAALGGLALIAWALLEEPLRVGTIADDWDYFFHVYEAVRASIIHYGQAPWWNVWSCGGLPLFANPQVGVLSMNTALVLLFGTVIGLKLSLLAHILVGFEGMRRLLRRYVSGPFAIFGATAFVACGGLAMHIAMGHFSTCSVYYLPWLLYFALRLPDGDRYGWMLGAATALMALESIHYLTILTGCVAAAAALCVLGRARQRRWHVAQRAAIAVGVFLLVAGFRLGLSVHYAAQYGATATEPVATLREELPTAFLSRIASLTHNRAELWHGWWEYGCYIGPVVVALFGFSLFRGPRYWHIGAVLCLLAAYSLTDPWSPSYWLAKVPLLRAMRVLTRWRLPAAFFIAMAAATEADALWVRTGRRWLKLVVAAICLVATADVLGVSHSVARQAFRGPTLPPAPAWSERAHQFFHAAASEGETRALRPLFPATRMNMGIVEGYEPLLGYDRLRRNAVRSRGQQDYVGEAVASGEVVRPMYWSPNRIVFEDVTGPLRVNLAPGSYWRINGKAVFTAMRVTELTEPFTAEPDASGRVVLTIVPSGWQLGAVISLSGIAVLAATTAAAYVCRLVLFRVRKREDPVRQTQSPRPTPSAQ